MRPACGGSSVPILNLTVNQRTHKAGIGTPTSATILSELLIPLGPARIPVKEGTTLPQHLIGSSIPRTNIETAAKTVSKAADKVSGASTAVAGAALVTGQLPEAAAAASGATVAEFIKAGGDGAAFVVNPSEENKEALKQDAVVATVEAATGGVLGAVKGLSHTGKEVGSAIAGAIMGALSPAQQPKSVAIPQDTSMTSAEAYNTTLSDSP